MSTEALQRELALRIGLAAKVLPGITIQQLMEVLKERVGMPLSEEKLKSVTVTHLKTGVSSISGEEDVEDAGIGMDYYKLAVRYLWGDEDVEPNLPEIQDYDEGDMSDSIRVAVASNGADQLDGHFGSCPRFLVYQLSIDEVRLVAIRKTDGADDAEDKNAFRVGLINDCHVMYVQSIGGPAAAKVVKAGIYPMKKPDGGPALESLQELQTVMGGHPPPWLAKILGVPAEQRTKYAAGA